MTHIQRFPDRGELLAQADEAGGITCLVIELDIVKVYQAAHLLVHCQVRAARIWDARQRSHPNLSATRTNVSVVCEPGCVREKLVSLILIRERSPEGAHELRGHETGCKGSEAWRGVVL